jgi:hypothetical protein
VEQLTISDFVLTTSTRHAPSSTIRHASTSTRLTSRSTTPPSFSTATSTSHEHVKGWRISKILVAKMNPKWTHLSGNKSSPTQLGNIQQLAHTARQQRLAHIEATRARQLSPTRDTLLVASYLTYGSTSRPTTRKFTDVSRPQANCRPVILGDHVTHASTAV